MPKKSTKKHVYNKATGRDYGYDKAYQKKPEQVKARVRRNKDRLEAISKGLVRKGDKTREVDHPAGKGRGKYRVISRSRNRAKH